ncbi:unnamed protein product [Clavelina lepadiformis]|uniref:Uncharacterized protein n=1 Tax=Clavelina lepadiformis TaxID=159417 RepID=A0ABP0G384_CLALP
MVQSLHRQFVEGQIPSTSSVEHFNLPIDSFEDFDRVESLLAEKSQARVFVSATYAAKKSGIKEAESICEIMKWLKNASDREGGRLKRMKNKLDSKQTLCNIFHYKKVLDKERKDEATRRQLYFMNFDSSSTSDDSG